MEDYSDIIIEALEVFINHILFVRDIYPQQIFKKRRIYNAPVYVPVYPPLNTYLSKFLRTSKELLKIGDFQCAEVVLYKDDNKQYESYKFNIAIGEITKTNDEFLLDFEEQIRSSLSLLSERLKGLEKLPSCAKFKILVHTTQSAFIKLTYSPRYQDFPWLKADMKSITHNEEISLLPLTRLSCCNFNLIAEIF